MGSGWRGRGRGSEGMRGGRRGGRGGRLSPGRGRGGNGGAAFSGGHHVTPRQQQPWSGEFNPQSQRGGRQGHFPPTGGAFAPRGHHPAQPESSSVGEGAFVPHRQTAPSPHARPVGGNFPRGNGFVPPPLLPPLRGNGPSLGSMPPPSRPMMNAGNQAPGHPPGGPGGPIPRPRDPRQRR